MCRKGNDRYTSLSRTEDSKSSCYWFKYAMKIRLMCRKGNGRYNSISRVDDSKSSRYRFKSAMKINKDNVSEMASITHLVEQRTQNPRVTNSNLLCK